MSKSFLVNQRMVLLFFLMFGGGFLIQKLNENGFEYLKQWNHIIIILLYLGSFPLVWFIVGAEESAKKEDESKKAALLYYEKAQSLEETVNIGNGYQYSSEQDENGTWTAVVRKNNKIIAKKKWKK